MGMTLVGMIWGSVLLPQEYALHSFGCFFAGAGCCCVGCACAAAAVHLLVATWPQLASRACCSPLRLLTWLLCRWA